MRTATALRSAAIIAVDLKFRWQAVSTFSGALALAAWYIGVGARQEDGRSIMRNYNLFCRPDRDELVCAVPEDQSVPAFIRGPSWVFVGRVKESTTGSVSFNHEAAEASAQFNGFYLFQLVNEYDLRRKVDRACVRAGPASVGNANTGPLGRSSTVRDVAHPGSGEIDDRVHVHGGHGIAAPFTKSAITR